MKFNATKGTEMIARYTGTCCNCDTGIAVGDSIARETGLYRNRTAYRHTSCPELELDLDTVELQIRDAQRLQYNAVMMRDRSGSVSRLDSILDELYRRRDSLRRRSAEVAA